MSGIGSMMFGAELSVGDEECDGGDVGITAYMTEEDVGGSPL